jgi:hypothetical protein
VHLKVECALPCIDKIANYAVQYALRYANVAKKRDWNLIIEEVNSLMRILKRKPKNITIGHWISPGSILNSYREGDLTFNQAVKALEKWKALKTK